VRPRTLSVALALWGALAAGAAASPAAAPRIAFDSSTGTGSDTQTNVFTTAPDGADPIQVTHDPAPASSQSPDWSPDRKRIVFVSDRTGPTKLWTIKADGAGLKKLTTGGLIDDAPAWSPAGDLVAFDRPGHVHAAEDFFDLFTIRRDGTHLRRVTHWKASESTAPDWSPTGDRLTFQRADDWGPPQVWTMGADGTRPRQLTSMVNGAGPPAWSPNGKLIAFASHRAHATQIFVVPAGGGSVRQVTHDPPGTFDSHPTWSPSSKRIVFSASHSPRAGANIASIGVDGTGRHQVLGDPTGTTAYRSPSWG
jgi:TolB protein